MSAHSIRQRSTWGLLRSLATLVLSVSASVSSHAEEPSILAVDTPAAFTYSGYVDLSYEHINGLGLLSSGTSSRVFDSQVDAFMWHQVALNLSYQPKEGFGYAMTLIAGQDPNVFAPYPANPGDTRHFDYPSAYVQYAQGSWLVMAGRYVTFAGAEFIDPTLNTNFSRSILYGFAIPFAHTGVRVTYAPSDQLHWIVGVNNGWDDVRATTSGKTAELGVAYTPSKAFALSLQGYFGDARVGGLTDTGLIGKRDLMDAVVLWNLTDALALSLNVDWGRQAGITANGLPTDPRSSASWTGVAGYVNYQFSEKSRTSLRLEYFDDRDGYRSGLAQKWKEATLTYGYSPVKSTEIRLEFRYDLSSEKAFVRSPLIVDGLYADLADNQSSVGLEVLYKF